MSITPTLQVNNLTIQKPEREVLFANVSFTLGEGEVLAVMGPSGIGKSMLAKAIAGFLPASMTLDGEIMFAGEEVSKHTLLQRSPSQRPAVIFQDALTALNPLAKVGMQLGLALGVPKLKGDTKQRAIQQLLDLGFNDPEPTLSKYPSQLSGGQRQRVCIAMALLGDAKLLIADEPTSALDPITERDILDLYLNAVRQRNISGVLITHDLDAALQCDKLIVLNDHQMVAFGEPLTAIQSSSHPFCRELNSLLAEASL